MQDYYLDSNYDMQQKHGYLMGTVASLYQWSMLGMGDKFLDTGKWSMPWPLGGIKNDLWNSGDVVLRKNSYPILGRHSASLGEQMGFKFRGATATGMLNMGVARALSAVNIAVTANSPGYYAARVAMMGPEAWIPGAIIGTAWFGGKAIFRNAAKAMRNTSYIDMGNGFTDNNATYTSRQRAVRAIAESHLQARSAIGNEAQLFHHSGG